MDNKEKTVYEKEDFLDRIFKGQTETKLLAQQGSTEILKQTIPEERQFYLDSSRDWEGFEFLYILEGKIRYTEPGPERVLEPGDFISRTRSTQESWFRTEANTTILWFSSEPVFHLLQDEISQFKEEAKEIENLEGMQNHSRNLERLSIQFGRELGLSSQELFNISYAAYFHDIGKAKVPNEILRKNGKLTDEEWKVMKKHATWGKEMIEEKDFLEEAAKIVEQTHERVDGNGYPNGLKGNEISIEAKIISIVDAYDAMTTDRVYRDALDEEEAFQELRDNAGTQFDEELVEEFLSFITGKSKDDKAQNDSTFDIDRAHLKQREYFLHLGEKVLAKAEVDEILSDLAQAVIDTSPYRRAIISLYREPINLDDPRETRVENYSYAGLSSEYEKKVNQLGKKQPKVNLDKFDEKYLVSNSYYVPYDEGSSKGNGSNAYIPSNKSEEEMDDWHPDDKLFIPLTKENQVMGHISVDDPIDGRAPTTERLQLIEGLANLGSLALTKTQRIRELNKQKGKIRALHSAGYSFVQAETLDDLFEKTVNLIEENFHYNICTILIKENGKLHHRASTTSSSENPPFEPGDETEMGNGIAGIAGETREPIMSNEAKEDSRYLEGRNDVESELAIPIESGDDLLGVIDIQSKHKNNFSGEDLELLETLAAQLAIAISNINRKDELKEQATKDPLTGVFNRRYFSSVLEKEIERSHRYEHPLALLMTDINDFKKVNDNYSHLTGDEVLKEVASVIQSNIRDADTVVRYGGDEFLVLFPETGKEVSPVIDRIKSGIAEWNETNDIIDEDISIATGLAYWSPSKGNTMEEALKEADRKMYEVKGRS